MSRADRVTGRLAERGADLLLVTNLVNIGYLTGFTGSSAMVVLGPETRRFLTDFRYVERARGEVEGLPVGPDPIRPGEGYWGRRPIGAFRLEPAFPLETRRSLPFSFGITTARRIIKNASFL